MKDCKDIKDLLSPFLEGDVAAREKAVVESHLESCSDCRDDLALLRQTVAALRSIPDLPPPAAILRGVREEISPAPAQGFFRRFFGEGAWVGVPLGALAMAVLGIAAFVLQDRYPELQEGPEVTAPRPAVTSAVDEKKDEAVKELVRAPVGKQVTADTPAAEKKAADRDGVSRLRAPEPPAEKPAAPAGTSPIVEGGAYDNAREKDTAASRPVAPPPPARTSPPAAVPPGDTYRSSEESSSGMKDVRRLLESSELLSPGRRDNGSSPFPGADDAPSGAAGRPGSEAMLSDPDGADESRPASPAQAAAPETKKSLKRKVRTEAPPEAALRAEDSLQAASREVGGSSGLEAYTEVLTLLSLRGNDMELLRRSIGEAGGQLLELKSLDLSESRDLARPFEEKIPGGQTISRGWRVRALLPAGKVDGFIEAVEEESRLRILNRTRTPAARRPAPGIQSLEIIVVQ